MYILLLNGIWKGIRLIDWCCRFSHECQSWLYDVIKIDNDNDMLHFCILRVRYSYISITRSNFKLYSTYGCICITDPVRSTEIIPLSCRWYKPVWYRYFLACWQQRPMTSAMFDVLHHCDVCVSACFHHPIDLLWPVLPTSIRPVVAPRQWSVKMITFHVYVYSLCSN